MKKWIPMIPWLLLLIAIVSAILGFYFIATFTLVILIPSSIGYQLSELLKVYKD